MLLQSGGLWQTSSMFFAGFCTVAQLSFWGNYLPRVYPTRLRGTGESFAANIGGRAIGVSAALMTTTVSNVMPGVGHAAQLAHSAGTVAILFLVLGSIGTYWLPEPAGDRLPE